MTLSERIKEMRKTCGYSQQQIARKLHITQGAISQWEQGLTSPAADQLISLADIFGITVDELLGRNPDDAEDKMAIREHIRRNPDLHMLFSTAIKADPKNIRAATAMLKAFETENEVD